MFAARHSLLVAQRRPIAFDVVGAGAGAVGPAGNTWSANFTVTAGSYVFGLICIPGSPPSNVRYGGNVMTLLADSADDRMAVYGLANAPGGSQAFSGNRGAYNSWRANVVSFLNVGSVDSVVDVVEGSDGAASQAVSCSGGQRILQAFIQEVTAGVSMSSISGGTNRSNNNSITINDSAVSDTFAGTASGLWAGFGIRMNPA